MYGRLNTTQSILLRPFVEGKVVHDFGASDLRLARRLLSLGARKVVAIEKDADRFPKRVPEGVEVFHGLFRHYSENVETAFVSWPVNWNTDLHSILAKAPIVIYLGTNTGGAVCGYPAFWRMLMKREILAADPHPDNCLIVYGPEIVTRAPYPEERAALSPECLGFQKAYEGVKAIGPIVTGARPEKGSCEF